MAGSMVFDFWFSFWAFSGLVCLLGLAIWLSSKPLNFWAPVYLTFYQPASQPDCSNFFDFFSQLFVHLHWFQITTLGSFLFKPDFYFFSLSLFISTKKFGFWNIFPRLKKYKINLSKKFQKCLLVPINNIKSGWGENSENKSKNWAFLKKLGSK